MDIIKDVIKSKIHTIRGIQVMLDSDLAELYGVKTKAINQAVKRNLEKFPEDFYFQLNENEVRTILKSQNVTSSWGGSRKWSYVFTEQGVAMLSGVLKSKKASMINIQIMRAFVAMRRFIASNALVFNRLDKIETKLLINDIKFEKVFRAIEDKGIKPSKGIFFDGQIFDAYKFILDLVKSANESIVLIDNYIDESVLTLLSSKNKDVRITIYTKTITEQLELAKNKFNKQYNGLELRQFSKSHDRFLIIDNQTYHIGASLKDLGKKWFAFSKFDKEGLTLLGKLE